MAVWIPTVVVPRSEATWAIDTFITDVSSVMRNCAEASTARTRPAAVAAADLTVTRASDRRDDATRGVHEPGERRVGPPEQLGMPLHAEHPAALGLEDLDRAVRRPPRGAQPPADLVDHLVVQRVDLGSRAEQRSGKRAVLERDAVRGLPPWFREPRVAVALGHVDVLAKRPPAGDVEQ